MANRLIPYTIILACLFAASKLFASGLGLDLGLDLGTGTTSVGAGACGVGFDELTGSDASGIKDSTGGVICCPQ